MCASLVSNEMKRMVRKLVLSHWVVLCFRDPMDIGAISFWVVVLSMQIPRMVNRQE